MIKLAKIKTKPNQTLMHFNLFATGLLLSVASALDLETSTDALLENEC